MFRSSPTDARSNADADAFEFPNNPVLLDLYCATQTWRIRVSRLGIVTKTIERIEPSSCCGSRKWRDDSRNVRRLLCARPALRQCVKPHTVDLSVCYQLPVNNSRSA